MTNGEKLQETFPDIEIVAIVPDEIVVIRKLDDTTAYSRISFRYEWWYAEYKEPTTKNNAGVDCIDRTELLKVIDTWDKFGCDADTKLVTYQDHYIPYIHYDDAIKCIKGMPSVTPQEPRCKDCKWWKDSDGKYRRGCGAESQCPINRREVYEGNGYCYMFSPKTDMKEVKE